MGYFQEAPDGLGWFGCGRTCGCKSCRQSANLSEWYVEDDDDEEEDEKDDDDDEKGVKGLAGPLSPQQAVLEQRIAHARELWRPAVQGGIGQYVSHQLGAADRFAGFGIHPADLAAAEHLGWLGVTAPDGSLGSRLVDAIKTCLVEIGKPNLIGRAGAMAACLAGFLAGPAGAPWAWTCLKVMGIVLTLATVAQLLVCVAAKMMSPKPATA